MTGEIVNDTEHRPALHTALRQPQGEQVWVEGVNVIEQVHTSLQKRKSWWSGFVMGSGVVILAGNHRCREYRRRRLRSRASDGNNGIKRMDRYPYQCAFCLQYGWHPAR